MNHSGIEIGKLLTDANIQLNLRSNNRQEVLQELVSFIPEIINDPESQETLLNALQEREKLHSTGIGDGVALPHSRNALVGLVDKPVIVFGRHAKGVPFGAIDGKPTQLFFLLVAPNVTQHLAMLARLSRLLRDPKVRQALLSAPDANKVIAILREAESK